MTFARTKKKKKKRLREVCFVMAKIVAEEITTLGEKGTAMEIKDKGEAHPYAFHVSGPRNVAPPNWRDLINSSWSVPFFPFNLNVSVLCD